MKVITSEPEILITSVATAAEIIDEGIFKFGKNGISLTAADRAMVAVIDLFISKDSFEEYDVEEEREVGLNMTNFLSLLKRARGSNKIGLEFVDNKLILTIFDGTKRRFTVPLLQISREEIPPIEQLEFKASVTLKPEILEDSIKDASVITDAVTFYATKNNFKITAEGDVSQTELELVPGDEGLIDLNVKEDSKAKYPLEYLEKILKAAKISDEVNLKFAQDYPMRIDFKYEGKARISMVLAPRVSE
ncbi:MAG: proliferating cell nuclear antigen (pcna) [Candidatus Aenigmatarchaeota archaeon]|jgi:proliferating cell nuclear antigen